MSASQPALASGRGDHSTWYRRAERFFVLVPWVLLGLTSMTQRVRSVGGTMTVESIPGEGTAISASVPAITVQV